MSSTGTWTTIIPASLTQSRRGGSSVSDSSTSIPCDRNQTNSSPESGRAIAPSHGLSIQVKLDGRAMNPFRLYGRAAVAEYALSHQRLMSKPGAEHVGLLPHLGVGPQEIHQVAGRGPQCLGGQ